MGAAIVDLCMQEDRARRVADALRAHGVPATLRKVAVYQFGVAVALPDGRGEAVWDAGGSAGLEAVVMADGMLRGFVPTIEGSAGFSEAETVTAIRRADYTTPVARLRETVPPSGPPLPQRGGLFGRLLEGFRDR